MAIKFEKLENGKLRAYSDNGKFLNEYDFNGKLTVADTYTEAINDGTFYTEDYGVFANGNTYRESDKDIEVEQIENQENSENIAEL